MAMHLVQKDNCCQGNHCSHGPARFDLDQSACRTRPYQPQATDLTQIKSWPDLLDYASFTTRETSMTTQGILITGWNRFGFRNLWNHIGVGRFLFTAALENSGYDCRAQPAQ